MSALPKSLVSSVSDAPQYYRYPEELREEFVATDDIEFRDGSSVTAAQVWHYLTEIGPVKYANLYEKHRLYSGRFPRDVSFPFTLKDTYLSMTMEDDLAREIKLHNAGRRLAIEIADLWWSADQSPTNGRDRRSLFLPGGMETHGDPVASLSLLREAKRTIEKRVKEGHRAEGAQHDAVRLFVCGSCVFPNDFRTEEAGGIIGGNDNHWSDITTLVNEAGDPYTELARAVLSYPYEQPLKERASWTADQIKPSRADGVLFLYKWGCNTQSAIARLLVDELRAQTGVPTIIIEDDMGATQTEQLQNRVNSFVEMVS
ncbi:2-hydroxyacyl-CoA dehydratase family protein [uncultured Thiodictyon sp.]|uniref:2-hydroxyacyl-CoA dehydratase family protein n=1 Tax=uncultured Thiodictyon sp. TaxID=1846217 RepID=UPI0025D835E8|nr:2-hydroxyacyl-CoA dehydratase family protein [uncultured Thiodictyon sp.]